MTLEVRYHVAAHKKRESKRVKDTPSEVDKDDRELRPRRRTDKGRLVLEEIHGGLTSIMQVCGLAVNREIKNLIKRKYLVYRREFIRAE